MRAGLIVALVAVVVALGPAGSAQVSAGDFPDLPGIGLAERATRGEVAQFEGEAASSSSDGTSSGRMPAPDSGGTVQGSAQSADAPDASSIADLPGTSALPLVGDPSSSQGPSTTPLILLAMAVVVLFTRFLVRLNDVR